MLIAKLQNELTLIEDKKKTLKEKLTGLSAQIVKAEAAVRSIGSENSPVTALDVRSIGSTDIDDERKADIIVALGGAVDRETNTAYEEQSACSQKLRECTEKKEQLKKEVDGLKKNQMSYPPNTVKLQKLIADELASRRIDSEVRVFADLLEVTNPEWQDAVEGYLNTQRFNLIVNPEVYDIAAEVYDRHKSEIHTVALVNTGALDLSASTDDTSLAAVIKS